MTCRRSQRLLSPYLDSELTAAEQEQVRSHLRQCPVCAERFQELENNRRLIRALPEMEVTAALAGRLSERLRRREEAPDESLAAGPQSLAPRFLFPLPRPLSSWRNWGLASVGTLATGTAAVLFYASTLQAPAEVSAEEVVSSMTQLLDELDPDDGAKILDEDTPEESAPVWNENIESWLSGNDDEQE